MTDVELAKKHGENQLKDSLPAIKTPFAYEDTAYHLPISFALTGTAVHDKNTALDVFSKTGNNPIVASECLLAEKTALQGKEPSPYTGFIGDTVIRTVPEQLPLSAGNCRKNICSPSLQVRSFPPCLIMA